MPTINKKKPSVKKVATKKVATKKAATKKAAAKKPSANKAVVTKPASKPAQKPTPKPAPKSAPKPAPKLATGALVAVGAAAPDFKLMDSAGKAVALSSLKGKPVVVYFYPKDDTSGCTAEACDFRDNLAQFKKLGCTVLGVSPDSVKSHAKFVAKQSLGALTLLADEPTTEGGTPAVCAAYGVWQEKSMYGRAYMGVVRTTYVIAKDGTVAERFDKVSVTGHVDAVLAAVAKLR